LTTVVVATNNAKKLKEIKEILGRIAPDLTLLTARDIALSEPDETGATFHANALIKAEAAYALTGHITLADDSGLEVDALGGAPGVHSARYAGPQANDADNNAKLLAALADVPAEQRTARYRCVITLIVPPGLAERVPLARTITTARGPAFALDVDGSCEGRVVSAAAGAGGFGYDPYILYEPAGLTFAELSSDEKHAISHRGKALRALEPHLRALLR